MIIVTVMYYCDISIFPIIENCNARDIQSVH